MSVEHDLQTERVSHLDLSRYIQVETDTPVSEVLTRMREQRRNCVLVTEGSRLIGIFTERDVLKKIVRSPDAWPRPVNEFMTPDPQTVQPEDRAARALELMNARHYRNVPVVDEQGNLVGNVTHCAVIMFLSDRFPETIYNLPPVPGLVPRAPAGA